MFTSYGRIYDKLFFFSFKIPSPCLSSGGTLQLCCPSRPGEWGWERRRWRWQHTKIACHFCFVGPCWTCELLWSSEMWLEMWGLWRARLTAVLRQNTSTWKYFVLLLPVTVFFKMHYQLTYSLPQSSVCIKKNCLFIFFFHLAIFLKIHPLLLSHVHETNFILTHFF